MKTVIDALQNSGLLSKGERILVAVSGGADSMCLLHALWCMREQLCIDVAAAHYEHGLRGTESLRDCNFVETYCSQYRIPLMVEHGDVAASAKAQGKGLEEAAREMRYDFLFRASEQMKCTRIATAHHLEDNAETILFHLIRGTGSTGLGGIASSRGMIIRPLLDVSRREIENYLQRYDVPHVEDSTNAEDAYTRNWIRHRILPEMRKINPETDHSLVRAGILASEDDDCLNQLAEHFIQNELKDGSFSNSALKALHPAIASRVIRKMCHESLSYSHVQSIMKLLEETELSYADVPGVRIRTEQGRLFFTEETVVPLQDYLLVPGETVCIPEAGLKISSEICIVSEEVHELFNIYYLKCDEIYGRLFLTARRSGDRISIHGRGCTKKLKTLFNECGMTQKQRMLTPVLRDEEGVLVVYGIARSTRAFPKSGDQAIKIVFDHI